MHENEEQPYNEELYKNSDEHGIDIITLRYTLL
jgi:hypothetical protein